MGIIHLNLETAHSSVSNLGLLHKELLGLLGKVNQRNLFMQEIWQGGNAREFEGDVLDWLKRFGLLTQDFEQLMYRMMREFEEWEQMDTTGNFETGILAAGFTTTFSGAAGFLNGLRPLRPAPQKPPWWKRTIKKGWQNTFGTLNKGITKLNSGFSAVDDYMDRVSARRSPRTLGGSIQSFGPDAKGQFVWLDANRAHPVSSFPGGVPSNWVVIDNGRLAIPSNAIPSNAIPSNLRVLAIPSNQIPPDANRSDYVWLSDSLAIPSNQIPPNSVLVNALPASALPASALPASALPASALPASALPSSALPSSALPSSALPASFQPGSVLQGSTLQQANLSVLKAGALPASNIPPISIQTTVPKSFP